MALADRVAAIVGFFALVLAGTLGVPRFATAQQVLINPEPTALYFMQYRMANTKPELESLTSFDPEVQRSDEFHKSDAATKALERLKAKQQSVEGVTELVINLSNHFGEYDDQYKEYDFDLSDASTVGFQYAFGQTVSLALTNGTKAQTWSLPPEEAAEVLKKTKGNRYVTLAIKLKLLPSPPTVNGEPMVIKCLIEEYDILEAYTSKRIGKVVVS
jgi:hypothetical protein